MGELSEQNRALIERAWPGLREGSLVARAVENFPDAFNALLDAARTEGRGEGEPVADEVCWRCRGARCIQEGSPEAWNYADCDECKGTGRLSPSPIRELGSAEVEAFLGEVRAELMRARSKFPGDRIMTIALAEEFGELCKAILDEPAANVRKEAVQTAVMAARVVLDGDGSVTDWRAERGLDPLVASAQARSRGEE